MSHRAKPVDPSLLFQGVFPAALPAFRCLTADLHSVAHRLLDQRLWRHGDADDVIQEAFMSFFTALRRGRRFESQEQLDGFLRLLVIRRVTDQTRRFLGTAPRPTERSDLPTPEDEQAPLARQGDPAALTAAKDAWQAALMHQRAYARVVIRLKEEGLTNEEVAQTTGRHARTIRKIVEQFIADFTAAAAP